MASETVEFEIVTDVDAKASPLQQRRRHKRREKMHTNTKKKSSRSRRKCWWASSSSSVQGGFQDDLLFFRRPSSLSSSRAAAEFGNDSASLTKQDHNSRRLIDECLNQGCTTQRRAYKFTRVNEEESTTQEEEEDDDEDALSSSSEEEEEEEDRVDPMKTTIHPCFHSTNYSISTSTCRSCSRSRRLSLSDKYRPKVFEDIIGHEINVKALSSAIHKDKVAPLYLFHGPAGTGKTSTATIFALASNCESAAAAAAAAWPCWSCRGCSTSLYINDLFCYESRVLHTGFERIKTLLHESMAMARAFKFKFKFKVFVVIKEEGCNSLLMAGAWDQLLSIADYYDDSVVFIMITGDKFLDSKGGGVSARCQKFSFPKLKDTDVILKLAQITAGEGIRIDRDALELIVAKANGSLREAENILEQVALLGSRITSSMVQQLVGLAPRSKLISLLDTAMSSDAITTVRQTRELIALGVQPQALISQLSTLIVDILSCASLPSCKDKNKGLSGRRYQLLPTNFVGVNGSQRLCHALKILIETEKQLQSSSDNATRVVAALLEFASHSISNGVISTNVVLPKDIISTDENPDISQGRNSTAIILEEQCNLDHHSKARTHHFMNGLQEQPSISTRNGADTSAKRTDSADNCTAKIVEKPNWAPVSDMDEVWQNISGRIHSPYLKEFLSQQGKLVSLTVSRANAIVHLSFKCQEDKLAAEISEEAISKALAEALACPVTINTSLQPTQLEEMERLIVSKNEVMDPSSSGQQTTPFLPLFKQPHSPGGTGIVLKQKASHTFASKSEHNLRQTRYLDITQMFQGYEENMAQRHQTPSFSDILTQGSRGDVSVVKGKASIRNMAHHKTCNISSTQLKHRWQSLSSIQQADASVEPYSQDLLFENGHTDGKHGTRQNAKKLCRVFSVPKECHHHEAVLDRSWSCTDIICQDRTMKMKGKVGRLVETINSSLLTLLKWTPRKDYSSVPGNEDLPNSH